MALKRQSDRDLVRWTPKQLVIWSLLGALCLLLIISRRPDVLANPQFWAEDGTAWYQNAHDLRWWQSVLLQRNGYLQITARLIALAAQALPLRWGPLFFNAWALFFQMLPVCLLHSARGRALIPDPVVRILLTALYLGHPYSSEVHANVTNIQWHLALSAYLVLCLPQARHRAGRWFDLTITILSALSGPFSIFLAAIIPVLWWQRRDRRTGCLAAIILMCAAVQVIELLLHHTPQDRSPTQVGASAPLFFQIFASKVVLGAILGEAGGWIFDTAAWQVPWLALALSLAGAGLFYEGYRRLDEMGKAFIVFAAMVFIGSLISPEISADRPQWQGYLIPGVAGRYTFIPIVAFDIALLALASADDSRWLRQLARGVLGLTLLFGVVANWRMEDLKDLHFYRDAKVYDAGPAGTRISVLINPLPTPPAPGWTLRLIK